MPGGGVAISRWQCFGVRSRKLGDPAHISYVQIKDDHIRFEINGGPIHRKKWYQHIQIQGCQLADVPVGPSSDPQNNASRVLSLICLFRTHVPELTAQQVRDIFAGAGCSTFTRSQSKRPTSIRFLQK